MELFKLLGTEWTVLFFIALAVAGWFMYWTWSWIEEHKKKIASNRVFIGHNSTHIMGFTRKLGDSINYSASVRKKLRSEQLVTAELLAMTTLATDIRIKSLEIPLVEIDLKTKKKVNPTKKKVTRTYKKRVATKRGPNKTKKTTKKVAKKVTKKK